MALSISAIIVLTTNNFVIKKVAEQHINANKPSHIVRLKNKSVLTSNTTLYIAYPLYPTEKITNERMVPTIIPLIPIFMTKRIEKMMLANTWIIICFWSIFCSPKAF